MWLLLLGCGASNCRLTRHTLRRRGGVGSPPALAQLAAAGAETRLNTAPDPTAAGGGKGKGGSVTADDRREVARRNKLDEQLYDFAAAQFHARLCAELGECDRAAAGGAAEAAAAEVQPLPASAGGVREPSAADVGYELDAGYGIDAGYALDAGYTASSLRTAGK